LWGIASEEVDAWLSGDDEMDEFEVWPDNWPTVQAFLAISTQWHWTGGMESRRAGLFYPSLDPVYEGLGIRKKKRPAIFRGLQTMEHAALAEFAKMAQ
jgi:hypothetical protein